MGRLGFEPRTYGLKVRCSAIELTARLGKSIEVAAIAESVSQAHREACAAHHPPEETA